MKCRKKFLLVCAVVVVCLIGPACPNILAARAVKFEGSRINDSVTAIEGKTVKWRFFTGGPVRYEPCVWEKNVYVGSDDGYLYCLNAATGSVVWKFFAGTSNRKMIGNERLISVWHISGGPVIHEGKVYFAAGTWPMLGVFIYCLDARTGKIVWLNDHTNSEWQIDLMRFRSSESRPDIDEEEGRDNSKGSVRYASYSVTPKGDCVVEGSKLLVPCGRAMTPAFDIQTGKFLRTASYLPRPPRSGEIIKTKVVNPETGQEAFLKDARLVRDQTANWDYRADRKPAMSLPRDPQAQAILKQTGVTDGYCLVLGIGDGRRIEGLLADSNLRLVVLDPDPVKVDALRRRLDAAGYYGMRVSALVDNPRDPGLPPYFASLMVVSDPRVAGITDQDFAKRLFPALRPYGGTICLDASTISEPAITAQVKAAALDKAEVQKAGDFVLLRRAGALTGAGSWSHQRGNAGNVFSSRDEVVHGPLGVLWFGGAAGDPGVVYPVDKRGRGIFPLVIGGRILYERPGEITAVDVYTGRQLWKWTNPDKDLWFMPTDFLGATRVAGLVNKKYGGLYGTPTLVGRMAATEDMLYVVSGNHCHAVDAATGKPKFGFTCAEEDAWVAPKVWHDQLFIASDKRVVALNRHTGAKLWSFNEFGGILAAGGGKVFCRQGTDGERQAAAAVAATAKRRGKKDAAERHTDKLVALDARSGTLLWRTEFRSVNRDWMPVYSEEKDLLFADAVYVGQTGKKTTQSTLRLEDPFSSVLRDRIISKNDISGFGDMFNATTGTSVTYPDPITKLPVTDFVYRGGHLPRGCSPGIPGENIMAFRINTAAYYDLQTHSGVCNIDSFRPACTGSMIPADGVISTSNQSTCLCSYPIYTSLALAPMPEAEMWTYFPHMEPMPTIPKSANPVESWTKYRPGDPMLLDKPIKQMGINFGAPGDRLADNNTLWLEYPMIGGPSPNLQVTTEPAKPQWFRYHPTRVKEGNGIPWVCASGAKDLKSVTIEVNGGGPYRVREYYAEPIAENDLKLRSKVVEHRNVQAAAGKLKWSFTAPGYVCGLEIIEESLATSKTAAN